MTKQTNVTSVFTRSCIRVVQAEVAVAQLEDGSFDVICNWVCNSCLTHFLAAMFEMRNHF